MLKVEAGYWFSLGKKVWYPYCFSSQSMV